MNRYVIIFPLVVLMMACSTTRRGTGPAATVTHSDRDVAAYADKYAMMAMEEMRRTGIPASITLAQGMIESDYGRSRLATEANNHFGIKCHSDWNGKKIYHDDDRRHECFRKYSKVEESFTDHSNFLRDGVRYRFLFDLKPDDYRGWAKGLKQAGYATNPRYANMLIDKIEENNLYLYDREVIAGRGYVKPVITASNQGDDKNVPGNYGNDSQEYVVRDNPSSRIRVNNRIEYIIAREGDTYESIIDDYDLLSWELFRYNDLDDDSECYPGQMLYLQPKRKRAEAGKEYHVLSEGETIYQVSQNYGIKLKVLCDLNHIDQGYEPPAGTELWLRRPKPDGL